MGHVPVFLRRRNMPKGFTDCVNAGGKVVTKKLKGNRYINICYGKDGKSYTGEVKKSKASKLKQKIENSKVQVEDLRRLQKHFEENYRNG
jgi:hypothetical protein